MMYFNCFISAKKLFSKSEFASKCKTFAVSSFKFLEFEVQSGTQNLFELSLAIEFSGSDHAGPEITVGLLNRAVSISVRDCRHWDQEKDTWAAV